MIVHSNKKDHLCDICGYASAHKSQLRAHKLIHTGATFKCDVHGCTFQVRAIGRVRSAVWRAGSNRVTRCATVQVLHHKVGGLLWVSRTDIWFVSALIIHTEHNGAPN